jgi:hypothetical protein
LFEDAAEPGRYLEYFMLESWLEHLRQHQCVTGADRVLQEQVRAFLTAGSTPRVAHFLAPSRVQKADGQKADSGKDP